MIIFNIQDVKLKLANRKQIRSWLSSEIIALGYKTGNINYIFCNDEYLSALNNKYLAHKTITDSITFDYTEGTKLSGDIVISVERVADNAGIFGKQFYDELNRVMIHGVLHLAGFKDKTEADKLKMRKQEDTCISHLDRSINNL